jgi:ribosomal protein L37AE/L43A
MENNKEIRCLCCKKRLGVPRKGHIVFPCPHCGAKHELFYAGVFVPVKESLFLVLSSVTVEKGQSPVVEVRRKTKQQEFLTILN